MYKVDGVLRTAKLEDLVVGTVLRGTNSDGTSPNWSDCTIVKVDSFEMRMGLTSNAHIDLVRPYMSQTEHGGWALQVEQFRVPAYRLLEADCRLKVVLMSTGKPATTLR